VQQLESALNRWPEILSALAGLTPEQLTNKHQPCPACGGTDRYRWMKDADEGAFFCNQCGGKHHDGGAGSGIDLLMRVNRLSYQDAVSQVQQFIGERPDPPTAGAERFWQISPDYIICRFAAPAKPGSSKPGKKIRPLLWDGTKWIWKHQSNPRPLYWVRKDPDAPILVTEGEPAADAAAKLFPNHAVATWTGGSKSVLHANWDAIQHRTIILWPDADDEGRQAMAKLAQKLLAQDCVVSVVDPPSHLPSGWDLADATGWTEKEARSVLREYSKTIQAPEKKPEPTQPEKPPTKPPVTLPGAPFTCLGFDDGSYYYQPSNTGQIIRLTGSAHTSTNLLRLARLEYWEAIYPGKNAPNYQAAVSSLFETQARVGVYSADQIRGRGAWWDEGRCVLHLGDRLIADGITYPVMKPPPSKFNYQRLATIHIPTDLSPLTDEEGFQIIDIASRFHWEVPASGLLLAGWTALAPICGALSWRPHAWLTAAAGSGKSAVLDRFLGPLLDSFALWPEGNSTEAFIRQELRADALPVIFDEAESNEKADQQRIQNILALARVSSSSGRGVIGKGGADGAAQRFTIRSMFLLCSISTALKQGADQSRFAQLTMRNPNYLPKQERQEHWLALDRDLTNTITAEIGHRLLLRSLQAIPTIRASVAVFRAAAADRFDSQRQGDQYGTLLAGAWSLTSQNVATLEDAYRLIDSNNWQSYQESSEIPDEQRCLQHILQHQIRVETDQINVIHGQVHNKTGVVTRTVWELIESARNETEPADISQETAEIHLGRIGLKVEDNNIIVSNTALGLQRILGDTPWAHSWPTVLSRLPGAEKAGLMRFKGLSSPTRAISIPCDK